jgi:metal-responsive CopG/Arc/MetJ family transcriptional regulator
MATERPRFMVSVDDELFARVEDFRFENRYQTRADAIVALLRLALDAMDREREERPPES